MFTSKSRHKPGSWLLEMILVGRERELQELGAVAALRPPDAATGARIFEVPAPLVVIYGGASTGKSASVAQVLRQHAEVCTGLSFVSPIDGFVPW